MSVFAHKNSHVFHCCCSCRLYAKTYLMTQTKKKWLSVAQRWYYVKKYRKDINFSGQWKLMFLARQWWRWRRARTRMSKLWNILYFSNPFLLCDIFLTQMQTLYGFDDFHVVSMCVYVFGQFARSQIEQHQLFSLNRQFSFMKMCR